MCRTTWPLRATTTWSDDFHHALHAALTGERAGYYSDFGRLADIAKAFRSVFVYDGRDSVFRKRKHGRPPRGLPGWRFIGFSQNHDQIGNRATGDRSSRLMSVGRLRIAAALVLLGPFIPMLFQGEEFGTSTPFQYFTNHQDPDLARAVTEGRRKEFTAFGWNPDEIPDPQDPETFARSKLDWAERSRQPHAGLLDWYKRLIDLRRAIPALSDGRLEGVEVQFDERERWLMMRRGPVALVCNLAPGNQRVPAPFQLVLLSSEPGCLASEGEVELPADSVMILGDAGGRGFDGRSYS